MVSVRGKKKQKRDFCSEWKSRMVDIDRNPERQREIWSWFEMEAVKRLKGRSRD
jgi:hypothetical protein